MGSGCRLRLCHSRGTGELATDPVVFVDPGRNTFTFDTHVAELGLSHVLRKNLLVHLDYRFHTLDQDGKVRNDRTSSERSLTSLLTTGTAQLEYLPLENLTLRGGYRVQYRDIDWDPGQAYQETVHSGGARSGGHGHLCQQLDRFSRLEALQGSQPFRRVPGRPF